MVCDELIEKQLAIFRSVQARVSDAGVATIIYQEINKDLRMKEIGEQKQTKQAIEPPTEKQIAFLKRNGEQIPATKAEAITAIDAIINKHRD